MHARVSRFQRRGGNGRTGDETSQQALDTLRGLDGFKGLISLDTPDGETALAITFWDSADALRSSEAEADRVRSEGAAAMDADILAVERFEVDVLELED
jgi:heme-degrading monooxygenase HmoA